MKHSWKVVALLLGSSLSIGCGEAAKPWDKVYPVKGSVKFDGKPVVGAQVVLFPVDSKVPEAIRPTATTGPDGTFEVGTHDAKDGAPAGEYKVAIVWHPLVPTEGGPVRGDNALPPKYSAPATSDLTASVKPEASGVTLASFELKK
jgi:hypothetical protein